MFGAVAADRLFLNPDLVDEFLVSGEGESRSIVSNVGSMISGTRDTNPRQEAEQRGAIGALRLSTGSLVVVDLGRNSL